MNIAVRYPLDNIQHWIVQVEDGDGISVVEFEVGDETIRDGGEKFVEGMQYMARALAYHINRACDQLDDPERRKGNNR